jgi:hypothetical protein
MKQELYYRKSEQLIIMHLMRASYPDCGKNSKEAYPTGTDTVIIAWAR